MARVKLGVMGCADIARRSMIPAIKFLPDKFDLVAVASRTEDKAALFAKEFTCKSVVGYDNLLKEDIEAVYIPLPTGLHDEWINKALLAGKHVYAEKSIAYSYDATKGMVQNAKAKNLSLMEGFMFQYHTQHQIVTELIKSGGIGETRCFRSSFGFPPLSASNFRYDNELGGGVVFDAAGYTVRAVHFILGKDYEVVSSSLFFDEAFGSHTYGSAFLKGRNGVGAQIAFGFDNFYQCNYEVWGSKGKITVDRAFTPGPDFSPTIVLETVKERKIIAAEKCNHFVNAMNVFHDLVTIAKNRDKHYEDILLQSKSLEKIIKLSK